MEVSTENVVNVLRKEYDAWIAQLSDKEKYAIEKYSWNSFDINNNRRSFFRRLNAMLRGESTTEKEMLNGYADIISGAIARHPIEHSVICYRGSDHDLSDGTPVGKAFVCLQFVSTSVIRTKRLGGRYEFVIRVPKGASAAYIEKLSRFKRQRELLIDRNTVFAVVARNKYQVELEVRI